MCLANYLFTVLLAFWTGFTWHITPVPGGNEPPSSVKYNICLLLFVINGNSILHWSG